jgi:hypothetical protein
MNDSDSHLTKLALLIDGDNISAAYMPFIMREAERLGAVAVRRIYGQFKSGKMKSWQRYIEDFDLTPVNVSPMTRGKNATDMKLVIEAMDMLYGRRLDGFCIASSDGDFTPLAARIRANAVAAYGFGAKKAPAGYKTEFDRFFECDTLLAAEKKGAPRKAPAQDASRRAASAAAPAPVRSPQAKPAAPRRVPAPKSALPKRDSRAMSAKEPIPKEKIRTAIAAATGVDGWAHSQKVGNAATAADRSFKVKKYASNMKALLSRVPGIELKKVGTETYVRLKP